MTAEQASDVDLAVLQAAGAERSVRLGELLEKHRQRLLRMVELRMDPSLKPRVGASDVLQEAYLEISGRVEAYLQDPRMPFFLWIRFITAQRLLKTYRFHAGAQKRSVHQEAKSPMAAGPAVTSIAIVDHLAASGITPSLVMVKDETRSRLVEALDAMNPLDREVLVLRNFEGLSNAEAASTLQIPMNTASKRYVRALKRMGQILKGLGTTRAP